MLEVKLRMSGKGVWCVQGHCGRRAWVSVERGVLGFKTEKGFDAEARGEIYETIDIDEKDGAVDVEREGMEEEEEGPAGEAGQAVRDEVDGKAWLEHT